MSLFGPYPMGFDGNQPIVCSNCNQHRLLFHSANRYAPLCYDCKEALAPKSPPHMGRPMSMREVTGMPFGRSSPDNQKGGEE